MKRTFSVIVIVLMTCMLSAQVTPTPSPIPVGHKGEITLTFDPTKGNGGMAKATECYSHIGLITEQSKDIHDWKYIKDNAWGTTKEPKWTKNGSNWELKISNMYTYFGCPESENITAIVMVFHNGKGGTSDIMEGKASNGSDILVYIGKEVSGDIWEGFTPAAAVQKARPAGIDMGIYYDEKDPTKVTLCTFAAANKTALNTAELVPAQHVFVIGDMTDWKLDNKYQMQRDGNYFWIELTGLEAGKEYRFQYAVVRADGVKKQICDLYSEKLIHPDDAYEPRSVNPDLIGYPLSGADGGYVSVLQTGKKKYEWSEATKNFKKPDKNNLLIYELWVYDHTPARTLKGLMERVDYLRDLGINCVELMPVNEFDGNINWGYSPNHYFALDKAYGAPEDLKAFVDACHQRGIAVVLDMVFNHATDYNAMAKLYPSGADMKLNPWLMPNSEAGKIHDDAYFYADWDHSFGPVRSMFTRVLKYWQEEYKVDGYRLDLSHGLCGRTKYDAVENLTYYYENGVKPYGGYLMLEHWGKYADGDRPTLRNAGMMCWANTSKAFQELTMGYTDIESLASANEDNMVSYPENHDEERCFFKAKQWGDGAMKTDEAVRAQRIPLVLGFQCMLNGPQLFYHFAELGFDYSKFQNAQGKWGNDKECDYGIKAEVQEEVKMQKKARPENLGWFKRGARMQGFQKLAQALQLRTRLMPEVFSGNPTSTDIGAGKKVRTVQWSSDVFVAANFSATSEQSVSLPSGTWYDYYAGGKAGSSYTLQPSEIKIFTGKQVALPEVPDQYDMQLDIPEIMIQRSGDEAAKVMDNGRLLIIRNGRVYDALGRTVK
ncbi:MAG: hypothetical protein II970_05310 [Paludibacteraceae bacterium]|nr:hypothetical protein [Paludibacteraceae bacterium]